MKIEIRERLRPFSHLPGTACLVPGSSLAVEVFPALLRIKELNSFETTDAHFDLKGPVKDFTVIQDLEKGEIAVFGKTPRGFMRYRLNYLPHSKSVLFSDPQGISIVKISGTRLKTAAEEAIFSIPDIERLSFGMHKALDWELVKRRSDLSEILPIWHRLGKVVPYEKKELSTDTLLEAFRNSVRNREKSLALEILTALFQTGFYGIFVPQNTDKFFQGFDLPPLSEKDSPLALLAEVSELLLNCFLKFQENQLSILPLLLPKFVHGKFCNMKLKDLGVIDLEWSKGKPRRLVLEPACSQNISFIFPKNISQARRGKGIFLRNGEEVKLEKGEKLYLDRFEH